MKQNNIENLSQINVLSPETTVFSPSDGGYLNVTVNGTEYKKITLCRALPHRAPDEYVSVADREKGEIGIIRRVSDFPEEQRELICSELSKLYYRPEIKKILSAKNKMGFLYMTVETSAGTKEFALRDPSRNIRYIDASHNSSVQITDVDGNRYLVEAFEKLDPKSAKKIEVYLV